MAHDKSGILEATEGILVANPGISLTKISVILRIERHSIEKVVRELTGRPFRSWRRALLMKRAAEILVNSKDPVKKLAIDFGYGSGRAFSRGFKDCFGIAPMRYRQQEFLLGFRKSSKKVSPLPQI